MRSIGRRFTTLTEDRPHVSSLINFAGSVKGQGFSKGMISRWFNQVVDEADYEARDKRALLKFMVSISAPEDDIKQA